ncbi:MAG: endonuclease/exonuclease/phosphatase family protein [Actinomycetota bacterium]|nr:endonuclease/exonuclease/phosphatase family protein [Actinomycetota bacterium]
MGQNGGRKSVSRTLVHWVLLVGFLVSSLTDVVSAAAAPAENASPNGQVVVITVNARQILVHSAARMEQLAVAMRNRPTASGGNYYAPDVILVNEVSAADLATVRNHMNSLFSSNYKIFGATSDAVKTKFLVNSTAINTTSSRTWADDCISEVRYQLINVKETSSGTSFTVGGVHFRADYGGSGGSVCKNRNAKKARKQLGRQGTKGSVIGDFNKRAMATERECDPDETSAPESWYTDMTSFSTVDNRSYIDAVRSYNRARGLTMFNEWTHEQKDLSTLCDGTTGYRRNRIDYIFVSDTLQPIEAHADHPGWANEAQPGTIGCTPAPQCKYSDHRFVWGLIGLK